MAYFTGKFSNTYNHYCNICLDAIDIVPRKFVEFNRNSSLIN